MINIFPFKNIKNRILDILNPRKPIQAYDLYSIHHRIDLLGTKNKKSIPDTISGFGYNTTHLNKVNDERKKRNLPTRDDFYESYDKRTGHYITGEKIKTKRHELHNYHLVKKSTNERYVIDCVCIGFYFGKYVRLLVRKEGTESHADIVWDTESLFWKEYENQNKEEYILVKGEIK